MSVQAGIWSFDGPPLDPKLLNDFNESLRQQGPDGESSYVNGNVAMLYRPFHTTAESRREKQPYITRRGFVLTWDGRVDNRDELVAELRSELEAHPTDVAIIGTAFDRWDTECFARIIGDWALTIWNPAQHELIFADDYMAVRHIFYYLKKAGIWWSTDLTPLVLLSPDSFHIDEDYIAGYLAHDPDAHLTPYREIRQVPPGQFVRIRGGRALVERYWRFSPKSRIRYKMDAEYEEHFRHAFRQSVRRRLRSDSPILAELSGGLDSSSIVCVADDIFSKEGALTPRLDTLSYYDKTEPQGDDWIYFRKVEERRGREGAHIDISISGRSRAGRQCPDFYPLPGPLAPWCETGAERACVVRNGGYRAVLSGLGGDEFMGGNPDPREQLADLIILGKLVALASQLMAWSLVKRTPWVQLFWQSLITLLPPSLAQHLAKEARVEYWIERNFAKRTKIAIRQLGGTDTFGLRLPSRRSSLAGVFLMANKLAKWKPPVLALEENRHPFLDQDLVEFVLCIPATQLLRPRERRSLMRRALADIVPTEILSRRTKQFGARTPIVALERNWEELRTVLSSSLSSRLGYINQTRFLEKLNAARNGQEIHVARMVRTISLEFWLRETTMRSLFSSETLPAGLATTGSVHASA